MFGNNKEECLRGIILGNNSISDNIILNTDIQLNDKALAVLTQEQIDLIPFIQEFTNDFFMVGGTAVALHLGHRRSLDFDLFTFSKILKPSELLYLLERHNLINSLSEENLKDLQHSKVFGGDQGRTEYILYINNVQIQFVFMNIVVKEGNGYNFDINTKFFNTVKSIDLQQLVGMKMFALIYRNKWKDIVDLYIIFKELNITLDNACDIAYEMYGNMFNKEYVIDRLLQNEWNKSEGIEFIGKYRKYASLNEIDIIKYFNQFL